MNKIMKNTSAAALAAFVVAGCADAKIEPAEANPTPHDMSEGEGLISGKSGNILDAFKKKDADGNIISGGAVGNVIIPVNPHLWRAALEAVSFMPLAQTDSTGGTILTDWYVNPNNTNERVKVNVLILGRQFQVQNLKVNVFKQSKEDGAWATVMADTATAAQLEDTILTNARKIKVQAAAE